MMAVGVLHLTKTAPSVCDISAPPFLLLILVSSHCCIVSRNTLSTCVSFAFPTSMRLRESARFRNSLQVSKPVHCVYAASASFSPRGIIPLCRMSSAQTRPGPSCQHSWEASKPELVQAQSSYLPRECQTRQTATRSQRQGE